jgi:isochorismate hydrolase
MIFITGQIRPGGYDHFWLKMTLKEAYFTPGTLARATQDMLAQCQPLNRLSRQPYHPAQSALLVLDMQRYFLDPAAHAYVPSAPAIIPGLVRLVQAFKDRNLPVFFTRHTNTPEDAGQMAVWWRDLITPESLASAISPEFDLSAGLIIEKSQYDAFFSSALETSLAARQVQQVVISGVMTHLCCETTARSAFMRGYQVFFLVDGTATYNQKFHQSSLLNLAHGFATIMRVSEVLADLEGSN